MNLAGRRIQQDFTAKRLPELAAHIKTYCPDADIDVDVDWDSFDGNEMALENLWLVYEQPSAALESVCSDDLGRKAVAEAIHKVLIRNVGSSQEVRAAVEDGTLVVSMQCAEAQSGTPGWPAIADVVTAFL